MKATLALAILLFSAVALGGRIYGEVDDIIKEVTAKYDGVLKFYTTVTAEIEAEKGKSEEAAATEAKKTGEDKSEAVKEKFEKDIIDTARSAIARGKPLAAIECIIRVATEGRQLIPATLAEHIKAVDAIKENRNKELDAEKLHADLIKKATEGLKEETLGKLKPDTNINAAKTLRADAIKKTATAYKQLQDIETRIVKPVLKERYKNIRNAIEAKYNDMRDALFKKLQKCIA